MRDQGPGRSDRTDNAQCRQLHSQDNHQPRWEPLTQTEKTGAESTTPPPQELADGELADQLLATVEKLIVEHPELVLRVAEAMGWAVVPPTATASS